MSDIIRLLPDSVANQIAAGEVIQRPSSVIKELVENAVDAGADKIDVLVTDAGRTSIQVIDNGKGMSETDARLSFERHATSKIKDASDLFALRTMGFRGEALASIAAVAQVELTTKLKGEDIGTKLCISGSKVVSQEAVSCPEGSNFNVQNLFFNVPARRKFLKTNTTELNNILTEFERIILVNPNISFTLYNNGTEVFNLQPANMIQRIMDVFGKHINQEILPVNVETSMVKISGYVGKPESARKKGAHQFFFVNNRYMKHPYFHKAVINAYERLLPVGEQVPYFLYFDVEPANIDVNIHPTKTEIKFEDEQAIWQILAAAVKESIGKFCEVPSIDFDMKGCPEIPVYNPNTEVTPPHLSYNPSYNPFSSHSEKTVPSNWENLYESAKNDKDEEEQSLYSQDTADDDRDIIEEKSPAHYQYKGQYIMTAVKSGLMIVDQRRAHIRILYEKYLEQLSSHSGDSQRLLLPEVVEFPPSQSVVVQKILPELTSIGFELSDLGGGSYSIIAIPAGTDGPDVVGLVREIVASSIEEGGNIKEDS